MSAPSRSIKGTTWIVVALVLSLAGVSGSLALSFGLGLKACPLCFYQRSFVMAVLAVLLEGLAVDRTRASLYCLLCVPVVFAGLGVAAFHEYLVLADRLECPTGLLGIGTAPAQSLAIFVLLAAAVLAGALGGSTPDRPRGGAVIGGLIFGLLLAWGSIASSPPLPPAPTAPYDPLEQPLEMCRPPYRPKV